MKTTTIKINGADIVLKFGYDFLNLLAEYWGGLGPAAVLDKVNSAALPIVSLYAEIASEPGFDEKIGTSKSYDIPMKTLSVFVDLIFMAATNHNAKLILEKEDILQSIFDNPESLSKVIELYAESIPKVKPQENAGKPNPAPVPAR